MNKTVSQRIAEGFIPEPNSGCHLWTGMGDKQGYGTICFNSKRHKVHRVAYELKYGKIKAGALIEHNCDTPACINPMHLVEGSPKSNMTSKLLRGRHVSANANKKSCKMGHTFIQENILIRKITKSGKPGRNCRACNFIRHKSTSKEFFKLLELLKTN